jgi:hypothetical protein
MIPNVRPSKVYPYAAQIAPQSVAAAATVASGWAAASSNAWLSLLLLVGAGAGTFAMKVEQATSSGGAGAKDLVTAANLGVTAQETGQAQVDVQLGANLDIDNGFAYVRVSLTCTGGAGTLAAVAATLGPAAYMN